jgi:hypothetical protein
MLTSWFSCTKLFPAWFPESCNTRLFLFLKISLIVGFLLSTYVQLKSLVMACMQISKRNIMPWSLKSADLDHSFYHVPWKFQVKQEWTNFVSVFRGHLTSVNTPPRKGEGSYTYSLRAGGILHLVIGVRHLPFLRSSCKNPPLCKPSQFMITLFASCFTMVKAEGSGTYPKCKARTSYNLILGLLFWECPPCCGLTRYVNHFENFPIEFGEHLISMNIPNGGGIILHLLLKSERVLRV